MALARRRPASPPPAPAAAPTPHERGSAGPPPPSPLWLALRLPEFPLQVFAAAAAPFAVTAGEGAQRRVVAANAAASALGVRPGLGISAALAFAPTLALVPQAAARERAALAQLAAWAQQFTPLVSLEPPDALLLEVRGSLKLFGGLEPLLDRVRAGLPALGYRAALAVAPTPRAALWGARAGVELRLEDRAALASALGGLPLAALGLEPGLVAQLAGIGVREVREALRLPRGDLGRRYGVQLRAELDRALGRAPEPRAPFLAPARFGGGLELACECGDHRLLAAAATRLTAELCGGLAARGAGVRRLRLAFVHRDPPPTAILLGLLAPTRDPAHLDRLLAEHLARTTLPAPARALELEALEVEPLGSSPLPLFDELFDARGAAGPARAMTTLLEALRARLGPERVHGLGLVADHRPERAWRVAPPPEGVGPDAAGAAPSTGALRPTWLLDQPQPLAALRGRPRWRGAALELVHGPERIESGWWDGADVARDYYRALAADGARLWVFRTRSAPRAWFLHGFFA